MPKLINEWNLWQWNSIFVFSFSPLILHQNEWFECQWVPLNLLFKLIQLVFDFAWQNEGFENALATVHLLLLSFYFLIFLNFNFYPKLFFFLFSPHPLLFFSDFLPHSLSSQSYISFIYPFLFLFLILFQPMKILHSFSYFFIFINKYKQIINNTIKLWK